MKCPNCSSLMKSLTLDGHHGRSVAIDICQVCQAIWFDGYESLQLSSHSVLKLFRIAAEAEKVRGPISGTSACPRCHLKLSLTKDMQRTTRFEYYSCPDRHGRLISFFNFLREKDFIRPLSASQIEELRQSVKTINCSNCGAPVDLAAGSACAHCGSPLSMIDVKQAEALVAALQKAGAGPQPVDKAALPLDLARARRDVTANFDQINPHHTWLTVVDGADLVGSAIGFLASFVGDS